MRTMIHVEDLCKSVEDTPVLTRINLTVEEGEVFGVLGHDGAGKTTLFHLLSGVTSPDTGSIEVDGVDFASDWKGCKARMGYLPCDIGFYEELTARENLRFFADVLDLPVSQRESRISTLLKDVGLDSLADEQVKYRNSSQLRRLGLAKTLLHDPAVVILDEPERGLDWITRKWLRKKITSLAREGKTILLSTGEMEPIFSLCTQIGVLVHGELYLQGKRADFQNWLQTEIHKSEIRILTRPIATESFESPSNTDPLTQNGDPDRSLIVLQSHLIQHGLEMIDAWEETITVMGRLGASEIFHLLVSEGFSVEVQTLKPTEEEQLAYLCTRVKWDCERG